MIKHEPVFLSLKELGYFTSRLLVAAHCPPGAAPELSRVIVAQDLITGSVLEKLTTMVDRDPQILSDVTPERQKVQHSIFQASRTDTPTFAWAPWVIDRIIAEAYASGSAKAVLQTGSGEETVWREGVLATRKSPNLAVLAFGGGDDAKTLAWNGVLYRNLSSAIGPLSILSDLFEVDVSSSGTDVTIAAIETDRTPVLVEVLAQFKELPILSQLRTVALRDGRLLSRDAWSNLERVVSRTLVPSSERSRLGAG